jgi:serine-type D-Ala-D-Ala carboxypeptidase (penicillin-binding protein 5/6)
MTKQIKKILIASVCILAIGLIPNWENELKQLNKLQVLGRKTTRISDTTAAPELIAIADQPKLTANSALAYDHNSGSILFTLDFDDKLPIASLTKIISALVVIDSGKINDVVTITKEDTLVIGANSGLVTGEKILASDLMKAMLIASHNDSTYALTRYVGGTKEDFVDLMNQKAVTLGMNNTNFTNPVGFDAPEHYSTCQDLVLALREFLKNPFLDGIVKTQETEIKSIDGEYTHPIKTTNKLMLEDSSIIGVKTGYTTEAKGNLIIRSVEGDADVVTIVLGSDDREGDTRKILDWIHTVYKW